MEVLWHCTGDKDQDHLQEKEMQKGKTLAWGGLTNSCEKREVKSKGEKERYTHLNAEFQRRAGEMRKSSSVISAKNIGKQQNGKD